MAVSAITENYIGERLDRVENFHGNQVLYIAWDHHLMFCAPVAFAVPPHPSQPTSSRRTRFRLAIRWAS